VVKPCVGVDGGQHPRRVALVVHDRGDDAGGCGLGSAVQEDGDVQAEPDVGQDPITSVPGRRPSLGDMDGALGRATRTRRSVNHR
jgi:hypothetical protein